MNIVPTKGKYIDPSMKMELATRMSQLTNQPNNQQPTCLGKYMVPLIKIGPATRMYQPINQPINQPANQSINLPR